MRPRWGHFEAGLRRIVAALRRIEAAVRRTEAALRPRWGLTEAFDVCAYINRRRKEAKEKRRTRQGRKGRSVLLNSRALYFIIIEFLELTVTLCYRFD